MERAFINGMKRRRQGTLASVVEASISGPSPLGLSGLPATLQLLLPVLFTILMLSWFSVPTWANTVYVAQSAGTFSSSSSTFSSSVAGSITSGTFSLGETITQATSGAHATLVAVVTNAPYELIVGPITGTPNSSNNWTGGTSGAVFTPSASPVGGTACSGQAAQAYTYFNNSSNWTTGTPTGNQIGPGTTVYFCGTISATNTQGYSFIFQGSGTPGNPITLVFDAGANLSGTSWGTGEGEGECPCTGAITISGVSYVTVNGGGTPSTSSNPAGMATVNGVIQNTNYVGGIGVYIDTATNVTVENLSIQRINSNQNNYDRATVDVLLTGTNSSVVVQNNNLENSGTAVDLLDTETPVMTAIANNYISDHCWMIFADANGYTNIYGNELTGSTPYGNGACHTDGVFSNGGFPNIYNNYIYGDLQGPSPTAWVYCTYASGPGETSGCYVFNNIFVTDSAPQVLNGGNGGPDFFSNNTVYGYAAPAGGGNVITLYEVQGTYNGATVENNVGVSSASGSCSNEGSCIYYLAYSGAFTTWFTDSDYNDYYNFGPVPWSGDTLAQWQSAFGFDTHSITTNPNLTSSFPYTPQTGSPAIAAGANLTSLCTGRLTQLCYDRSGNARPKTGAWDMGATQVSTTDPVAPPTGLTATVN